KFVVQRLHKSHSVPDAIEKIRITERNVLRSGLYLLTNILEHNFAFHNPEDAFVNRNDGAVPAKVFASPTRFRVAGDAMLASRENDVRVFCKRRESLPVGRNEFLPSNRDQRLGLLHT